MSRIFLIHPAAIASGKGFNAYDHYGLTYEKTTKWDYKSTVPAMALSYPYEGTGDAWKNRSTEGDGINGPLPVSVELDKASWHVGGGLSVKF